MNDPFEILRSELARLLATRRHRVGNFPQIVVALAIKLAKGTHVVQVVIDPNNRVSESDKTTNTFRENKLVCK